MLISVSELADNLSQYLQHAAEEDIFIADNGKVIAKLSAPYRSKADAAAALFGILSDDTTLDQARNELLNADP